MNEALITNDTWEQLMAEGEIYDCECHDGKLGVPYSKFKHIIGPVEGATDDSTIFIEFNLIEQVH